MSVFLPLQHLLTQKCTLQPFSHAEFCGMGVKEKEKAFDLVNWENRIFCGWPYYVIFVLFLQYFSDSNHTVNYGQRCLFKAQIWSFYTITLLNLRVVMVAQRVLLQPEKRLNLDGNRKILNIAMFSVIASI